MKAIESTFSASRGALPGAAPRADGSLMCSAATVAVVKSALAEARRELLATRGSYAEIAHIEHAIWLLGGLEPAPPRR